MAMEDQGQVPVWRLYKAHQSTVLRAVSVHILDCGKPGHPVTLHFRTRVSDSEVPELKPRHGVAAGKPRTVFASAFGAEHDDVLLTRSSRQQPVLRTM